MAKLTDIARNPAKYAERAQWKARRFSAAFRNQILRRDAAVVAVNKRLETVDYGPRRIFLETASPCNLRCPFCPTGARQVTRKPGFLKLDLVEKFLGDLKHMPDEVGLWLAGEPTLNKDLPAIVRRLGERDLPTGIHTNATRLTPELSRALIEGGLRWISFSWDGMNREMYQKMRVGGDFDETLANIKTFLRAKKELGSKTPWVIVQVIVPFENEQVHPYGVQLETPPEVLEQFEGLPVDSYRTILAHAWSGQFEGGEQGLAPNHINEGERMACDRPYTDLTITWNGDAVTCCADLNGANILGNLYNENLYDLWNNQSFREIRRQMHTPDIEKRALCGTCERIWTKPHPLDYELRLQIMRYKLRF